MPPLIRPWLVLNGMDAFKNKPWTALIWTLVIFYLLSMDTSGVDKISLLKIYGIDKLIHLGIFLIFGWLWGTFLKEKWNATDSFLFLTLCFVGSSYGMGMEYYQKFFTNRSFSYWDGVADALGVAIGSWYSIKKPLWK